MTDLISFYLKEGRDNEGRSLTSIWKESNEWLEFCHDWVQTLFPTIRPSMFNEDAPLLNDAIIAEWHKDKLLQHNLRKSFLRTLNFLGLEYEENVIVLRSDKIWKNFNHNWLRVTRILDCTHTLGLDKEATDLYNCLEVMYQSKKFPITELHMTYWSEAIGKNGD